MLRLYSLPIPRLAQRNTGATLEAELALGGALEEDLPITRHQGSDPDEQTVAWYYRGERADLMAAEVESLATAAGVGAVPMYDDERVSDADGYYAVERADVGRVGPQSDRSWEIEVTLRLEGRRGSHYRSTDTTVAQVDNPFGTDSVAPVGIPAAATRERWVDGDGTWTPVTDSEEIAVRSAEFGDVRVLDVETAPYADPALVYDLDYTDEMRVSPVAWGTRGHDSRDDADGNRQWRHHYGTAEDLPHSIVLSTGLVRLWIDPDAATASDQLQGEAWDDASGTWNAVSLGDPGTWTLFDVDITRAADDRLAAQLTFYDTDTGDTVALDAQLATGDDAVLFSLPANESGPLPSGIETWLDPVAATHVYDAQPSLGIVPRREVRR